MTRETGINRSEEMRYFVGFELKLSNEVEAEVPEPELFLCFHDELWHFVSEEIELIKLPLIRSYYVQ